MWKCVVCNKENSNSTVICSCGMDWVLDHDELFGSLTEEGAEGENIEQMRTQAQERLTASGSQGGEAQLTEEEMLEVLAGLALFEKRAEMDFIQKISIQGMAMQTAAVSASTVSVSDSSGFSSSSSADDIPVVKTQPKDKPATPTPPPSTVTNQGTGSVTKEQPKPKPVEQPKTTPKTDTAPKEKPDKEKPKSVRMKKSILPKTLVDWIVLLIGVALAVPFIGELVLQKTVPSMQYFLTYRFLDLSQYSSDWKTCLYLCVGTYLVMYISLALIQYKRWYPLLAVYAVSSVLPICWYLDLSWGIAWQHQWVHGYVALQDWLHNSFFYLWIGLGLLAIIEKPLKKKNSILPRSPLQVLTLIMGVALVVIYYKGWANYYMLNKFLQLPLKETWIAIGILWVLAYMIPNGINKYPNRFWKIVCWLTFSVLPMMLVLSAIWYSEPLIVYCTDGRFLASLVACEIIPAIVLSKSRW